MQIEKARKRLPGDGGESCRGPPGKQSTRSGWSGQQTWRARGQITRSACARDRFAEKFSCLVERRAANHTRNNPKNDQRKTERLESRDVHATPGLGDPKSRINKQAPSTHTQTRSRRQAFTAVIAPAPTCGTSCPPTPEGVGGLRVQAVGTSNSARPPFLQETMSPHVGTQKMVTLKVGHQGPRCRCSAPD